jgi:Ca2+-transporting ATPase
VVIKHDAVPGRIRFGTFALRRRPELVARVEAAMSALPGVRTVRANAASGSVLIEFCAPATAAPLSQAIAGVLAGRSWPPAAAPAMAARAESTRHETAYSEIPWHALLPEEVLRRQESRDDGLDGGEADRRLQSHGPNDLARAKPRSAAAMLKEQLSSLPVALLGASSVLSLLTGGLADAVVIAAVIALNAGIATVTERRAQQIILGLSEFPLQPVNVRRGGGGMRVDPRALVPGDILMLERGTLVPADARLLTSDQLAVNESALTGESLPTHKDAGAAVSPEAGLSSRPNMVYRGTAVTGGSGTAVVTATGSATEIGRIQGLLGSVRPPQTPIQRQLGEVETELTIVNAAISGAILALGLLRGQPLLPTLRTAISLAVAAIPEGLPAVATTTLAVGVRYMRRRDVLVRKLDAVETLGAVEVLGLDKTGTLTESRMAAVAVHAGLKHLELSEGRLAEAGGRVNPATAKVVRRLFEVAALSSEAVVQVVGERVSVEGTPTECALIDGAHALGIDVPGLRREWPLRESVMRGDGRKRMSTVHMTEGDGYRLCVKGDPMEVLARCSRIMDEGAIRPLHDDARQTIRRANLSMAGQALRVLGVAMTEAKADPRNERDLVWLGLAGLANPIRPSVPTSLQQLHEAGIRTVMITGDQSATAAAIAQKLDLGNGDQLKVLEAGEIAGVQPELLAVLAEQPHVFARVSPVDKLNIVRALQAKGRIVAMTGDGVNDGPALRAANVGIAMGGEGTDVAREVADIVLVRDDLNGVVDAVRLGRATHDNIRKVLRYLVSTNASETVAMVGAALVGGGSPLSPMQLLWLNLATDPLPALALGLEPPEADIMRRAPVDPKAGILATRDFRRILREAAVIGGSGLAGYYFAGGQSGGARASTIAFHGLTMAQLLHAFASRSGGGSLLPRIGASPNPWLYGALGLSAFMQVAAQVLPVTRRVLGLAPMGGSGWLGVGAVALGSAALNRILRIVLDERRPDSGDR